MTGSIGAGGLTTCGIGHLTISRCWVQVPAGRNQLVGTAMLEIGSWVGHFPARRLMRKAVCVLFGGWLQAPAGLLRQC
jgi:hypothetical protein